MNKIALIGDLHFGAKNFNSDVLEKQLQALEKYAEELREREVFTIFQLGDFFDNRKVIEHNFLYDLRKRIFKIFEGFKVYTLVGNHDMFFKDCKREVNASSLYMKDFFYEIVENPKVLEIGSKKFGVFPYEHHMSDYKLSEEFKEIVEASDIILGHLELKGYNFNYSSTNTKEDDVELNDFKGKKVFMGHFHYSNQDVYIGTPYQMGFNEFGGNPKIVVLNLDTMEEEYIENTWSDRYFKVEIYSDRVMISYDSQGFIKFNGKNLPSYCKIGKVYVKEHNDKLEQILEYFSAKADNISIVRENVINEIKESISAIDLEGISGGSVNQIIEFVKGMKDPKLDRLLEKLL